MPTGTSNSGTLGESESKRARRLRIPAGEGQLRRVLHLDCTPTYIVVCVKWPNLVLFYLFSVFFAPQKLDRPPSVGVFF